MILNYQVITKQPLSHVSFFRHTFFQWRGDVEGIQHKRREGLK